MGSFEQYGPLLQNMIKDSNLIAAYEALLCLNSYVRFSLEIKAVTFACHNFLLEKVQTNKPNFKDVTLKILLCMLKRDQGPMLFPELLKRFRSKNPKSASFCMAVLREAFKTKTAIEDLNLKTVFRSIQDNLSH